MARNNALNSINDTIQKWKDKIINPNEQAISKLLQNVIDPNQNEHNMDEVHKINSSMAKLFQINHQGRIALDLKQIQSLPASNILSIDNIELNNIFDGISKTLKYNIELDQKTSEPNKRIRNGPKILYGNIPRLDDLCINNINTIIGNTGNRLLLHPKNENELHQFGILLTISNKPNNHKLHWDLINTPLSQMTNLQCIRSIIFQLNMELNPHNDINIIKQQNHQIQQSQLSSLATTLCKSRFPTNSNKDHFWVTDRSLWQFCGTIIAKCRKLYVAIGALNRDLCKYAFGKVIVSRTNWRTQTFQIIGDIEGKDVKNYVQMQII